MSLFISALGTIIGVPLQADTAREESTPALTIAVVGASGNQGSGVVDALLNSTDFNVRGITTHISDNSKVKELLSDQSSYVKEGRFEFVEADLNDRDSLEKALKGCCGVFAAFGKGIKAEGENGEDNEVTQGKNLVDAAKACDIRHFVYSSLPSIDKLSGGQFRNVSFFEAKAKVEEYAKEQLKCVTILIPGVFYSNLDLPMWANFEDHILIVGNPHRSYTEIGWVDEKYDIGRFAAAVFNKGMKVTGGKTYPVNCPPLSNIDFTKLYTQLTGEPADYKPAPIQDTRAVVAKTVGEDAVDGIMEMFAFLDSMHPSPCAYGVGYIDQDTSFEDLGVRATNPEDFFRNSGWRIRKSSVDTSEQI